jgi:hypothetical protein
MAIYGCDSAAKCKASHDELSATHETSGSILVATYVRNPFL